MSLPVLIVDGYNIIGAWDYLKEMKKRDLGSARDQLIDDLSGFLPWCWERIIIVFDGQSYEWEDLGGVEVVFTGKKQTADTMIEHLAAGLVLKYPVEVATSDIAENRAASAVGAMVISASALQEKIEERSSGYRRLTGKRKKEGLMLNDLLNESILEGLEKFKRK
ncbi:MAG: NYN domain-containing protein [Bacillota bacterium]